MSFLGIFSNIFLPAILEFDVNIKRKLSFHAKQV